MAENQRTIRARAAAAKAEAESRAAVARAEAEGVRARAEAEATQARIRGETAARELAARQAREATERAEREAAAARATAPWIAAWKFATSVGAPVAGFVIGRRMAHGIEARQVASIRARGPQLIALARSAAAAKKTMNLRGQPGVNARLSLQGIVRAADRTGLTRPRGPLGLGMAGLLIAEGSFARFVAAPSTESEIARDVLNAAATGSFFAASALVAERAVQRLTPKVYVSTSALGAIESARQLVRGGATAAGAQTLRSATFAGAVSGALPMRAPGRAAGATTFAAAANDAKPSAARRLGRALGGGVLVPAVVAGLAYDAARNQARAAGHTGAGAEASAVATGFAAGGAALAAGKLATLGVSRLSRVAPAVGKLAARAIPGLGIALMVYGAVQGYRRTGTLIGTAAGAVGLDDFVTPAGQSRTMSGRQALAGSAALRSAVAMRRAPARRAAAAAQPGSDGITQGYTAQRILRGKTVAVSVRSYRTPARRGR